MHSKRTVFMFSGQGSQYFQMGRSLFDADATFNRHLRQLDECVKDVCGRSVIDLIYHEGRSKSDDFSDFELSGPAIFMVQLALARTLVQSGLEPSLTLGASMGCYAALALGGALEPEEVLVTLIRQARGLNELCPRGVLLSVLGPVQLHEREPLRSNCDIAAINFDGHFVIATTHDRLPIIEAHLNAEGKVFQRVAVAFPFHSHWIDPARKIFESASQANRDLGIPMACCARAEILRSTHSDYFWEVVRTPIRFGSTLAMLERQEPAFYVDIGPSGTLATFVKYGLQRSSSSVAVPTLTPFGGDEVARLAEVVRHCRS